jgi:hypothetical protein
MAILFDGLLKVFFTRSASFPKHAHRGSKAMRERGISCATSQDREASNRVNLIDQIIKEESLTHNFLKMKNNNAYIFGAILAVAILILYILHFTSTPGKNGVKKGNFITMMNDSSITLPVAYVNVDSLLMNYNFAKDLNEALMRTEESSRASLTQKERQLNAAARSFNASCRTMPS